MAKKKKPQQTPINNKFLKLSYVISIIAFIGALLLFFIPSNESITRVFLFLLPLFVLGAVIFAIIDYVLIIEHPELKRKLLLVVSVCLSLVSLFLYIIGLGRLSI
jgi:hypothetical protein